MRRVLAACLFLLLLAACGSGGGSTVVGTPAGLVDPNTLFTGEYGLTWLEARADVPDVVGTRWGTLSGDGAGMSILEYTENQDGVISIPPVGLDLEYEVGLDHVFALGPFVPGTSVFRGALSDTGDVACFSTSLSPLHPSLAVATRRSGTHDVSSLSGGYFYISYSAFAGAGLNVSGRGTVGFDGAGAASFVTNENFEGALAGPNPVAATYVVAANGEFTMTLPGGLQLEGSIGAGGEVLTAGGGTAGGDDPTLYVFVRRGIGYADADLTGPWHMNGFLHEFLPNEYSSFVGGGVKDGGGVDFAFAGILSKDGVIEGVPFSTLPLTIDAGGNVALEISPGIHFRGGMSADRRFMILAGADQPGSDPGMFFFMR